MFNARNALTALLVCLAACTPTADDPGFDEPLHGLAVDEEPEPGALVSEQDGARIPAAPTALVVDHAEREHIEDVRASSCSQDRRAHAPHDLTIELAEGLVNPRYRVQEDQRQAAFDFAPEDEPTIDAPEVDLDTQDAQARYLAEAEALEAEFTGTRAELAEARAELKAAELGE